MTRPTAWQARNVPRTLTRRTRSNSSGGISSASNRALVPATLTRMSILPNSCTALSAMSFIAAASVRSAVTATHLRPSASISLTVAAR